MKNVLVADEITSENERFSNAYVNYVNYSPPVPENSTKRSFASLEFDWHSPKKIGDGRIYGKFQQKALVILPHRFFT